MNLLRARARMEFAFEEDAAEHRDAPDRKAECPKRLHDEFRGSRFAREDIELLNYEGSEFILVGASRSPEAEYGIEFDAEHEDHESSEEKRRMHMAKSRHPIKPLVKGHWE